jgi:chromosome segregation ATPase
MIRQISSQVQSSKSATEALQQVYQTLLRAETALSWSNPAETEEELSLLLEGLSEVKEGLSELKDEVSQTAADQRIFRQMESSVEQSISSIEKVVQNPQNATPLKSSKSAVLSSIGRMEDLSQNLEKASLNVMRISSAYVPLSDSRTDLTSLYGLSTAYQTSGLGVALDQVS